MTQQKLFVMNARKLTSINRYCMSTAEEIVGDLKNNGKKRPRKEELE